MRHASDDRRRVGSSSVAIDNFFLQLVVQARDFWAKTAGQHQQPPRRPLALGLGYPDLLVDEKGLAAYLDAATIAALPVRDDSPQIIQWHPSARNFSKIFDSLAVFDALKIDLEVSDMAQHRGCERIVDLNEPLPAEMEQRYDLLIDTGTLEHCFNVGLAFKNMCAAMRQGGILVHAAPLNRYNHGFWSFNPTLYHDFFGDNGYAIRWIKAASVDANGQTQLHDLPPFQGFVDAPARSAMLVVAQRETVQPLIWPVQRKYRATPAVQQAQQAATTAPQG
jgi:SAM-dependent methyltransferase